MICARALSKQLEVAPYVSEFITERFPPWKHSRTQDRSLLWRSYAFIITASSIGAPGGRSLPLHVVVHRELVWMGAKTQRVVFFLFHVDPVGDEIFVEHVASE